MLIVLSSHAIIEGTREYLIQVAKGVEVLGEAGHQ